MDSRYVRITAAQETALKSLMDPNRGYWDAEEVKEFVGELNKPLEFEPDIAAGLIEMARDEYANDNVNIDEDALFSEADDGCWVQAWVWVEYPQEDA